MSDAIHANPAAHAVPESTPDDIRQRARVVRGAKILSVVVLILLAAGAGRTIFSRMANAKVLEAGTEERAKQYVNTAKPRIVEKGQTLALPGTLQGYMQSPIAARAPGYLKRWYKDIGAKVQKGELLAELDTPETDQQLSQAVAARQQAASSLELAKSTAVRWESLRQRDAVSQQELDERRSAEAQARANLAAADANVERLRQLENFKRVVAPFSGVIIRRNVDTGDLIEAGSGANGKALFVLAQTDVLRVYINVPQSSAQLIKPGQTVVITQAELRGQKFQGEVARTSGSIDASSRTMQVEVSLPNKDGTLLPGAFVQVSLPLKASGAMLIPTNALLIRGDGMRVAVIDGGGKVTLRPIQVGRNLGENVEVVDGVDASDRLVLNPSDSLADGDVVIPAPAKAVVAKEGPAKSAAAAGKAL